LFQDLTKGILNLVATGAHFKAATFGREAEQTGYRLSVIGEWTEMHMICAACTVRLFRADDAASLAHHANDRAIWSNLRDRFPHPYTLADARAWIAHAASDEQPTSFAIDVEGEVVGGIGLRLNEDVERTSAEIGYWVGRAYWGRGIATDAVRAVTEHAFTTHDLTRVYALPFAENAASIRVLEKAGYVREGLLRRSAIKDGVVRDQLLYAVVR
jgi:ribosomal-protein-alanine N-acetyltransferase